MSLAAGNDDAGAEAMGLLGVLFFRGMRGAIDQDWALSRRYLEAAVSRKATPNVLPSHYFRDTLWQLQEAIEIVSAAGLA